MKLATLYGKGPSLWSHDFTRDDGRITLAVNDAGYHVPRCDYLFMHDPIPETAEIARRTLERSPTCILVLPAGKGFSNIIDLKYSIVWYHKMHSYIPLDQPSDSLWGGTCTAHSAAHFCQGLGIEKIRLVGFDGKEDCMENYYLTYPLVAEATRRDAKTDENFLIHHNYHLAKGKRLLLALLTILEIEVEA